MAKFKCHQHQTITRMKAPTLNKVISHHMRKDIFPPSYFSENLNMSCPVHATHAEEPMDTTFTCPPFAYPTTGHQYEKINQILQFSLRLQKEEDISNCSGFVSYVISLCLKAVNIDCSLDKGIRKTASESSPHMWLIISGVTIDNCYTKMLTKENIASLEKKHPKCYESQSYTYSNSDLTSVEKDRYKVSILKTKKLIDLFMKDPHKALALCLNREELNNYFFGMIRFVWDEHKVNISGIDPGVRYICWQCGKCPNQSDVFLNDIIPEQLSSETSTGKMDSVGACAESEKPAVAAGVTWKFPLCGSCKIASYCSRNCQGVDWKNSHRFTCQTLSSVCLLPSDGLD